MTMMTTPPPYNLAHIRTKFMDWLAVAPDEDAADMVRDFNDLFRKELYYRGQEWTPKQIEDARIGDESGMNRWRF